MPEITQIILLVLVGVGAGFVQRVSGFGLGIFAMLFLPHFMPTHTAAAAVSCLFSSGTSTYNAAKYRKDIPFGTVVPLLAAAFVMIPVAVYFASSVSGRFFKIFFGSVLVLLSIYFLFFDSKIKIRPTVANGIIAGGISGILNGLFSTGGPPVVLYLTHAARDKEAYFAGIQFFFCLTNIYSVIFRLINGILTANVLISAAIGFAGCMAGDFIGRFVFDKLDAAKFKRIIYVGMALSGILMIIN